MAFEFPVDPINGVTKYKPLDNLEYVFKNGGWRSSAKVGTSSGGSTTTSIPFVKSDGTVSSITVINGGVPFITNNNELVLVPVE